MNKRGPDLSDPTEASAIKPVTHATIFGNLSSKPSKGEVAIE